ncbi:MAG TPA: lmo0937 family membrane protein [Anaerolineae bacterium]|nr:lmo0937 family membrane protein [Anaerolineae bacterium]
MIETIVIILLMLWLLGVATNVVGGLIHILLAIAIVAILARVVQGRRVI